MQLQNNCYQKEAWLAKYICDKILKIQKSENYNSQIILTLRNRNYNIKNMYILS